MAAIAGPEGAKGFSPLASNANTVETVVTINPDLDLAFALLPGALDSN